MTPLNDVQKQLLFDYSFGMTDDRDTAEAERLLASHPEACEVHRLIKSAIEPLDNLELEPCPNELAERTIMLLKEQARMVSGRDRLRRLIAGEQVRTVPVRVPFWRNWSEVVTAAAVVVLFLSVLLPTLGLSRHKYWQHQCQAQLGGISDGLAGYVADHDGRLPTVAMTPGAPWWKVGYPGRENYSNTRRGWLLVQGHYVAPERFLCPARREDTKADFKTLQVDRYNDFPGRAYIHFSIRISQPQAIEGNLMQKRALLADLNPVSEMFPQDLSAPCSVELCQKLMTSNSRNHRGKGQNVLMYDGSVVFVRTRRSPVSEDDIYTLQGMSCGQKVNGCEVPASENDTFLAP